jgi:Flp pilus assembly protein TadB
MNTEHDHVTRAIAVFCALACLSAVSPVIDMVITILTMAAILIGIIGITKYLVRLHRATDSEHHESVPPETLARG